MRQLSQLVYLYNQATFQIMFRLILTFNYQIVTNKKFQYQFLTLNQLKLKIKKFYQYDLIFNYFSNSTRPSIILQKNRNHVSQGNEHKINVKFILFLFLIFSQVHHKKEFNSKPKFKILSFSTLLDYIIYTLDSRFYTILNRPHFQFIEMQQVLKWTIGFSTDLYYLYNSSMHFILCQCNFLSYQFSAVDYELHASYCFPFQQFQVMIRIL
ncbi:unnamed protein product (macronuclear) [Paramecium tetraurelia]|uniref:Transmembrane protein n=1 Tax=Paramecium tetraurelia TaxID=5888 RepID=A0C1V9_PARTE|nr:uncharacterized protein GSPATT00034253001 [Paramecium tetraurelia]CAK64776.1 unnamed protein product [Paramecium tetraurelia]|eukprot:XP_001432173.1 hypothetical protein (macronuclear) [Paramecium tetraurelia strain d4-2]